MINFTGIIILKKNGQVLLQKRDNKKTIAYPNFWSFPGGSIDKGETPKEGAIRELYEETGYESKRLKLFDKFYDYHRGKKLGIIFFWDEYDNKTKVKCYEGQKLEFVSLKKVIKKKYLITPIAFQAWTTLLFKNKINFYDNIR